MYTLPASIASDSVSELAPGTSVLIIGPSMSGKRELVLDMLTEGLDEETGLMLISTQKSAENILGELERRVPTLDRARVGIVDCSGSENQQAIRDITTQRISSPGDLTGISIGTVKLMEQLSKHNVTSLRHGLVSVSTMLQYIELPIVFKFLHIYTRRITDSGGIGIFTLDSESHDQKTINTIRGEFDGVIELRLPDHGGREMRVQGFGGVNTSWTEI